jgi:lipopolysaccharide cholinephosphotransferase
MNKNIQLRKAQLYIANEIKRICDLHQIKYFLDCGSMLGAIRHQGFIPWDDDMDIGMLKSEYNRFLEIAPSELGDDFFLDNYQTNPDNALVFSKVRLKGTKYIEAKGCEHSKHNEVFVDIFPYYFISDNERERKWEAVIMAGLSQAILSKSGHRIWKGEPFTKRLKCIPTDLIGACCSKKKMHEWINKLYYKHTETARVCIHAGSCYSYWFFPRTVFSEYINIQFEGNTFKIPKQYDTYLSTVYGNYMEIPPENKRITHRILELDMGPYIFD